MDSGTHQEDAGTDGGEPEWDGGTDPDAGTGLAFIQNDVPWTDVAGAPLRAQGGSMVWVDGVYYWFGQDFRKGGVGNINVYSSRDLSHWVFRNAVFQNDVTKNGIAWPHGTLGRPDVLYNAKDQRFVMILAFNPGGECPGAIGGGCRNRVEFLTSSSPTGDFSLQPDREILWPDQTAGDGMGDHGAFLDSDGAAYLLFITDQCQPQSGSCDGVGNAAHSIAKLDAHFTAISSILFTCWAPGGNRREALAMVREGGQYYLFSSQTHGWFSSSTGYKKSATLDGFSCTGGNLGSGWNLVPTVPESFANNSYNTQHAFVLPVHSASNDEYIYVGDRWSDRAEVGGVGLYFLTPLKFSAGVPSLIGRETFGLLSGPSGLALSLSTPAGAEFNAVLNGGFEWDINPCKADQACAPVETSFTGWTSSGSAAATPDGGHTGTYQLSQGAPVPSFASSYQTVGSLSNGSYVLSAFVRAGGATVSRAVMKVSSSGTSSEFLLPLTDNWTEVSIPFSVTNAGMNASDGSASVDFITSDPTGGFWSHVDDVRLWKK